MGGILPTNLDALLGIEGGWKDLPVDQRNSNFLLIPLWIL
jgi:hypothetical protein